jgi:hypothetical protein
VCQRCRWRGCQSTSMSSASRRWCTAMRRAEGLKHASGHDHVRQALRLWVGPDGVLQRSPPVGEGDPDIIFTDAGVALGMDSRCHRQSQQRLGRRNRAGLPLSCLTPYTSG